MKFLKEKKGIIISFIIGVIIASSVTVYATSYLASQVNYKQGKTVEQALNELYNKKIHKAIIESCEYSGGDDTVDWSTGGKTRGYGIRTFDITSIPNYQKLTKDNFAIELTGLRAIGYSQPTDYNEPGINATIVSYENGILTINVPRHTRGYCTSYIKFDVVAYYYE